MATQEQIAEAMNVMQRVGSPAGGGTQPWCKSRPSGTGVGQVDDAISTAASRRAGGHKRCRSPAKLRQRRREELGEEFPSVVKENAELHRECVSGSSRTAGAEEEQNDEQMSAGGSEGMKRKAEDDLEGEPMEVMDCMCENAKDVNIVGVDDELEECKADGCMEETTRNLTGKVLKHEKVIDARLDEIRALQDMGVWEVVPVAECVTKTQKKPIRERWTRWRSTGPGTSRWR